MKKKKNFVRHCSCALLIDEAMEGSCSFEPLVGTPCSFDRRNKHRSTDIVPLLLCNKDVTGHRSTWSFSGIESETDLILARVGIFSMTSRDLSSSNICPFHRSELGIGWRRNSYSNSCQVPKEITYHNERREKPVKADRRVGKNISEYIHQQTGILIPVGSGTVGLIIEFYAYKFLRLSAKKLFNLVSWITQSFPGTSPIHVISRIKSTFKFLPQSKEFFLILNFIQF